MQFLLLERKKACVYGGIEVDKKEEDVLKLPPGYKTFPKLKISEMNTELEKCMIKSRWQRNREMINLEQAKVQDEI